MTGVRTCAAPAGKGKTAPGNANALAVALDRENFSDVVGTIAGDDTILVIAPDHKTAEALRKKLLEYLSAD